MRLTVESNDDWSWEVGYTRQEGCGVDSDKGLGLRKKKGGGDLQFDQALEMFRIDIS